MKIIILGSGASKGTVNAPTANEFGKYLYDIEPCYNSSPYLKALIKYLSNRPPSIFGKEKVSLKNWGFDKVLSVINNKDKMKDLIGKKELLGAPPHPPPQCTKKVYKEKRYNSWDFANHELQTAIIRIYGCNLIEKINKALENVNCSIRSEFQNLKPDDCVVSFNYDYTAEKFLNKIKPKNWASANPCLSKKEKGKIILCKPHGSLTWKVTDPKDKLKEKQDLELLCRPICESEYDYCPERKVTIRPGIIAPVPYKSELIFPETKCKLQKFYRHLSYQWIKFLEKFKEADELVVMGYRFPPEDLHLNFLISNAVPKRNNKKWRSIKIYQTKDSFCDVRQNLINLLDLNEGKIIHDMGPVECK